MQRLKDDALLIQQLHQKQAELDEYINNRLEHPVPVEKQINKKILALLVETGECANEYRGFKFWSKDQEPRVPLLAEYVDIIHFVFSLANSLNLTCEYEYYKKNQVKDTDERFIDVFGAVNLMYYCLKSSNGLQKMSLRLLYTTIINLGEQLGFTDDEVIEGYNQKHRINVDRQNNGY